MPEKEKEQERIAKHRQENDTPVEKMYSRMDSNFDKIKNEQARQETCNTKDPVCKDYRDVINGTK